MKPVPVSDDERNLLLQYKREYPIILVQAKSEAILLAAQNVPISTISRFVERQESTVKTWIRQWHKTRMASIHCGHENNLNASKLTIEQRNEACQLLQLPPNGQGIPKEFWDVPTIAGLIKERFNVVYESPSSYHFLFHLAGLSLHYPEKLDKRRDDKAVEQRMEEIRQEITPLLKDPEWEVYAGDEVRLDQEAEARRAWYKKGTKTVIRVDRDSQYQNYFGLLNQSTGDCYLDRLEWQNGDQILAALKRFVQTRPGKSICIVWDNASWHKTKIIREALQAGGPLAKMHLIAMPPYAPDENPIEHVWNYAKTKNANIQNDCFDTTLNKFEKTVSGRKFHYTFFA